MSCFLSASSDRKNREQLWEMRKCRQKPVHVDGQKDVPDQEQAQRRLRGERFSPKKIFLLRTLQSVIVPSSPLFCRAVHFCLSSHSNSTDARDGAETADPKMGAFWIYPGMSSRQSSSRRSMTNRKKTPPASSHKNTLGKLRGR